MSIIQKSMRNITRTPPTTVKPLMISWARLCERAIFASEVSETVRVSTSPCCCLLYAARSTRRSRLVSSMRTSYTMFSPARPIRYDWRAENPPSTQKSATRMMIAVVSGSFWPACLISSPIAYGCAS